jgi:very-short-patch-repair endonuclease
MPGLTHSLKQVQNRDKIKTKELINAGWKVLAFNDNEYTPQTAFDYLVLVSGIEPTNNRL